MAVLSTCYPLLRPSSHFSFPCTLPCISRRFWNQNDAAFRVSATSKPRSRSGRTKSSAELLSDIREFLASVGLPHDHVPSTKELSQNGRQDLANIVRRRGYKFVKELLENGTEDNFIGELQIVADSQGLPAGLVDDDLASSEASETDEELAPDNDMDSAQESSLNPFLQERVAKFVQHGILDDNEDYDVRGAEVINGSISSPAYDVEDRISEMYPSRIENAATEEARTMDLKEDSEAQEKVNQKEIDRLKLILHQKELELSLLKEQIEKEKLALTIFQTKAEEEINETQKLISEKDAELHAAEESLSGLEEVEIEFWSDGEVVEVAGSFNGWHQRIKLESQPPSSVSVKSQKSRHWKILLWLYPGVYEMKFIVDGHWTVDHDRETVTTDSVHNNILRVGKE